MEKRRKERQIEETGDLEWGVKGEICDCHYLDLRLNFGGVEKHPADFYKN